MSTATTKQKAKCPFHPLSNRVIVRRADPEDASPGGIVLPEQAQEQKQFGIVLAVGPGKALPSGERLEMTVKTGDMVVFGAYAESLKFEDAEFIMLTEEDIYATCSQEE